METDFRSMLFPRQSDMQSPSTKSSEVPFDLGLQHIGVAHVSPAIRIASIYGAISAFRPPLPAKAKEPQHDWLNCLPSFRQGFNAGPNPYTALDGRRLPCADTREKKVPLTSKQFLVFDQNGNKTTLIYSSEISTTPFCCDSLNIKPPPVEYHSHNNIKKRKFEIWDATPYHSGPNLTYEGNDDATPYHSGPNLTYEGNDDDAYIQSDGGSETREDTEEINALLYSKDYDDEKDSSDGDDEVTSRCHYPPGAMADYSDNDKSADLFDDQPMAEDVASSFSWPTKRVKLFHGGFDVSPPLTDNSGSAKIDMRSSSEYEDDAESMCGDWKSIDYDGLKGWRKERILETVSILQSIVPGGKGKDTLSVIDEAIHYLRYLKVIAKSLGVS